MYINTRSKSSDRKLPISVFQSQFSMSKIIRIFLNLFFIEEYQFRGMFFVADIFFNEKSAFYHSIKLPFDAEVAEKILNVI